MHRTVCYFRWSVGWKWARVGLESGNKVGNTEIWMKQIRIFVRLWDEALTKAGRICSFTMSSSLLSARVLGRISK